MFRISHFMRLVADAERSGKMAPARRAKPTGPVVIWNLIRRCNLTCTHCYALSADHDYAGELSTAEAGAVMDDLEAFGVPVLIL
jgi:MoaA/NifB/PqqE/SkfB family radical SAM enzyme